MVIFKTEAMTVVYAWITLPAAAVVDGDMIGRMCSDVKEHRVLAFRVHGVVLQSGEEGVIKHQNIVEAVA